MRVKRTPLIDGDTHDEKLAARLREKAKKNFGSESGFIHSRDSAASQETRRQALYGKILPSPTTILVMLELGFSKDEVAKVLEDRKDTLWANIIRSTEPGVPLMREAGETMKDFETINFPERTYAASLIKALARPQRPAHAVPGNTPLHLLALGKPSNEKELAGIREAIEILTKSGFDINAQNQDGKTPLMYACEVGNEKLTLWLLDQVENLSRGKRKWSVDPTIRDKENRTVVSYASGQKTIMQKLMADHPALVMETWAEGVVA